MDLQSYLTPLRRWWWLLLVTAGLAMVSTLFALRQQPPIYEARATLVVGRFVQDPNPSTTDLTLIQQLAGAYADLGKRQPVQDAARAALGINRLPDYTVRVSPNSQVIEVAVVDTLPERAQAVANEIAHQIIEQSPNNPNQASQQRQNFIDNELDYLQGKIKETQDEIAKQQAGLADQFSASKIALSRAEITSLQEKLTSLQATYASMLANSQQGAANSVAIQEPAALPFRPLGPNRNLIIALAGALGLLLAAGGVYLLEYFDDALKNADQVQHVLGLNVLGSLGRWKIRPGQELAPVLDPYSPPVQALRILRTNLEFATVDRPLRSLLITSPGVAEGKTLAAVHLAAVLAASGQRVVLVEGDVYRPRVHTLLGLDNPMGLTTALLEQAAPEELLRTTTVPGLAVLTAGPLPAQGSLSIWEASRLRKLLNELERHADLVIIDSPPVVGMADTSILATQVDGVLLLLDATRTKRSAARNALQKLRQVRAPILGVVLNRVPNAADVDAYLRYARSGRRSAASEAQGRRARAEASTAQE
jgi:capsular exopolysaccharide synthesis family protein